MKRIVCFHLLNDYSGSPKVLKNVLDGLLVKGWLIEVVSSKGGVLDDLQCHENLRLHTYPYSFSSSSIKTLLRYSAIQLYTFFISFRWVFSKDTIFYINTLLPVGPALAGKFMGKRVVYHYHENAFAKGCFYKILAWMMQRIASKIICVSVYQASFLKRKKEVAVIPNALSKELMNKLHPTPEEAFRRKNVLMLSSLKRYKGICEYMVLARELSQFKFTIVVNDTWENVTSYMNQFVPFHLSNLKVYPRQSDVSAFYNAASLLINLTNPKEAIETFGLTALEAMSAGLPVIVPTIGGIAEMVEDGVNGYKIDVQDLNRIKDVIVRILTDSELYMHLSANALATSRNYDDKRMAGEIESVLSDD